MAIKPLPRGMLGNIIATLTPSNAAVCIEWVRPNAKYLAIGLYIHEAMESVKLRRGEKLVVWAPSYFSICNPYYSI